MTNTYENFYSLDVEADGPCPGLYSMLSFGLVPLNAPERGFYTTMAPISDRYVERALGVNGWTREQTLTFQQPAQAMAQFADWLAKEPGRDRKVIWSDNPAFDWQFFNYYCHAYLDGNPFGHSARRISDYSAGLEGNPRETSKWKKWRTEKHTNNALDDARGNAGALRRVLAQKIPPRFQNAQVSAYTLGAGSPHEASLETAIQRDGSVLWAVRKDSNCMNQEGKWEYEPQPSSRDDAFFKRCRWPTAKAAYQAWERAILAPQRGPGKPA